MPVTPQPNHGLRRGSLWIFGVLLLMNMAACSKPPANESMSTRSDASDATPMETPMKPSMDSRIEPMIASSMAAEESVMSDSAPTASAMSARAPSAMSFSVPPTAAARSRSSSMTGSSEASAASLAASSPPVTDVPDDFRNVEVYYATDRMADSLPLSAYQLRGQRDLLAMLGVAAMVITLVLLVGGLFRRIATVKFSTACLVLIGAVAAWAVFSGQVHLEKEGVGYTGGRGRLVHGVCNVTVPNSHRRGNIEQPSLLKFELSEDPTKHIMLTRVVELDSRTFNDQLASSLDASDGGELLVFIHGYNVSFESAVQRTAQIAIDLPFAGVPVCYSWPSQGTLLGYPVDENNVAWTVSHLRTFLTGLLNDHPGRGVHVVAHSMGNRAMTAAMQQLAMQQTPQPEDPSSPGTPSHSFESIVLAAPDVDADLFRKDLAVSLTQVARQVTLYASSDDQALIASKQVHGYPRAGESGPQLVIVPGVETVDVSGIDLSLLGHSYYGDSEWMLRDLQEVIFGRLPASRRTTLVPRLRQTMVYYQLTPPPLIGAR